MKNPAELLTISDLNTILAYANSNERIQIKDALHAILASCSNDEERIKIVEDLKKQYGNDVNVGLLINEVLVAGNFLREKVVKEVAAVSEAPKVSQEEIERKRQEAMSRELIEAIQKGNIDRIQQLIASGIQVNTIVDINGIKMTPLYQVLVDTPHNTRNEILGILVKAGADFRFGTGLGKRIHATWNDDETCLQLLVKIVKNTVAATAAATSTTTTTSSSSSSSTVVGALFNNNRYCDYLLKALSTLPETCDTEEYLVQMLINTVESPFLPGEQDEEEQFYMAAAEKLRREVALPIMTRLHEQHATGYALAKTAQDFYMQSPLFSQRPLLGLMMEYCEIGRLIHRGFALRAHVLIDRNPSECDNAYFARLYTIGLATQILPNPIETVCRFIETNVSFSNTKTNKELEDEGRGAKVIRSLVPNNSSSSAQNDLVRYYNFCYRSRRTAGGSYATYGIDDSTVFQVQPSLQSRWTVVTMYEQHATPALDSGSQNRLSGLSIDRRGFLYLHQGREIAVDWRRKTPDLATVLATNDQFKIPKGF